MSLRKFEFHDNKSSKFWDIEINGTKVSTRYGKVGSTGQTTEKKFDTAEKAQTHFDKMIGQKTSKGYDEVTDGGGASDVTDGMPFAYFNAGVTESGSSRKFAGKSIINIETMADLDKKGINSAKKGFRVGAYYDNEESFEERMDCLVNSEHAAKMDTLLIGMCGFEHDVSMEVGVEYLVANAKKIPNLKALYFGDIGMEENEISWIIQTDVSPLFSAFPKLELLRIRGGNELSFKSAKHKNLRALAVETGGLDRKTLAELCKSKLPNLEYLEIWLGTTDYGGTCTVNDVQPILTGKLFPKLKYLGLMNADISDDIAGVIVKSPVIDQIETLDLSMGTLSDAGGRALLNLTGANLKKLDLTHHFLSDKIQKELKKTLNFPVVIKDKQEEDDWGDGEIMRYVEIGE